MAWPLGAVHLWHAAVPQSVVAAIAGDADALAAVRDNFWVTKERVLAGPPACTTPAELAVALLHAHVAPLLPPDWRGCEYWLQTYAPGGGGLAFHFDKDEAALVAHGSMAHPAWSSILYLTGGCDAGDVRQAPTVILQQVFDADLRAPVPEAPPSSVLVWPQAASFCVFDGTLGHGVLASCSSTRRATLLVNWWSKQPQGVAELQLERIPQLRLTQLSGSDVDTLVGSLAACSLAAPQQQLEQQQGEQASNGVSQPGDQQPGGTASGCGPLPRCRVAVIEGDEDASCVQLVDDVLAAHGVAVTGHGAMSAVAFDHPGFELCPVEPQDGATAHALAAFVLSTGEASSSASSSSSSDGEGSSHAERALL